MNDFERRALDITQSSSYLALYARQGKNIIGIDYFAYNTSILQLAAAASASSTVQIQSDSDFIMTYLSGNGIAAGAVVNFLTATCQITDTGTGKTFFNQPALMGLIMGQGGYPFLLPAPRVIAPNTNIKFDITNISAATTDYYITMAGARVYYSS